MRYNLKTALFLSYIVMILTILSCFPAYSLTNNVTDAKLANDTTQKIDSSIPLNQTTDLQNPNQVVDASTSCIYSENDMDGDKIPNVDEVKGVDINNDNEPDLDLKKLGANPYHKDLFLEVDYMKYHKPIGNAINDTISSFANSPLCNPDGIDGINLHVFLSEEIPHQNVLDMIDKEATTLPEYVHFRDFYKIKSAYFGDADERLDPNSKNILDAKKKIYHYGLFIHTVNDEKGLLGIAKDIPAYDFVVSLGGGDSPNSEGHLTGTESEQESTFMHEFGHTIGLYHGGNDPDINNKPNYISIMNYLMTNAVVADSKLDFSRCALDTLNERALSEPNGISGITNSCLPGEKTAFYNACAWHPRIGYFGVDPQLIETGNPVDWATPVSGIDSTIKQKNINCDQNDNGQRYTTEMKGYEDWHNLISLPTTPTTTGDTAEDLGGESPVQSSNNETQNLNHIQTNNTNDDIKIKTLVGDEPTRTDITFQTLGVLAGITSYIENNIDESSFQEPTEDLQGNTITSDPFAEGVADPAAAGKEYYQTILGDPLFLLDPSAAESGLGKEEAPKDNVANNIIDGDIDSAIEKLDNLLLASDSSLGGVSSNDRIKNPSDQQELLEKIANLQNILKKQSCTYDRCN